MSWLDEMSGLPGFLRRSVKFLKTVAKFRLGFRTDADLWPEVADLIGDVTVSMSSMPMLAMGHDNATGRLFLNGDLLDCDWSIAGLLRQGVSSRTADRESSERRIPRQSVIQIQLSSGPDRPIRSVDALLPSRSK